MFDLRSPLINGNIFIFLFLWLSGRNTLQESNQNKPEHNNKVQRKRKGEVSPYFTQIKMWNIYNCLRLYLTSYPNFQQCNRRIPTAKKQHYEIQVR